MRTNYCGLITEKNLGQEVELYGWINRVRDHGKMIFIDLRDREGIVQVFVDGEDSKLATLAKSLHNEYVLAIKGKVRSRPEGLVNKEMRTGGVEVLATSIDVINSSEPLPFQINESQDASEEMRLKYRYIDMRRPEVLKRFVLRSKLAHAIREYLDAQGFLEIETPFLTKSTPEGARDYLVPSRVQRGEFYALPQSPQIFKQLLMVAGIDKYYQIVRCFRDEDLRADRQPEFTQVDFEMSFIDEDQVMELCEELFKYLMHKSLGVEIKTPLLRLPYWEAMRRFGSDKPDLRIDLEFCDIADLVKESDFKVFADAARAPKGRVIALRVPGGATLSRKQLDGYTELVGVYGLKGLGYMKINDVAAGISGLQSSLMKFLDVNTVQNIVDRVAVVDKDLIFFAAHSDYLLVSNAMGALRIKVAQDLKLVKNEWQALFVTEFPLFERREDGTLTSSHHPFTAPLIQHEELLDTEPEKVLSRAYDLVLNGTELGGGSIRIHKRDVQKKIFNVLGISDSDAELKFGHLLEAFKYGCPPHGGAAWGLDRLAMLIASGESLRDVIAFPKTQHAICPLTNAPSVVSEEQLKEVGIDIIKNQELKIKD